MCRDSYAIISIAVTRPNHHLADLFISLRAFVRCVSPDFSRTRNGGNGKGLSSTFSRCIRAPTWLGCQHSDLADSITSASVALPRVSRLSMSRLQCTKCLSQNGTIYLSKREQELPLKVRYSLQLRTPVNT